MGYASHLAALLRRPTVTRARFIARLGLWRVRGDYEEREWYLLPFLVDRGRAAVDVGGNYGAYAARLAELAPRVHCLEAFPPLAERLRQRLPPNVVVHACAASDREGVAEFAVPLRADGSPSAANASLEADNPLLANVQTRRLKVQTRRLDDLLADESVGFIKVDVEGHEAAVLRGAERLVERCRPTLLVETSVANSTAAPFEVFELMRRWEYTGFFLDHGALRDLSHFDFSLHQQLDESGRLRGNHVFNYVFLPRRLADDAVG